MEKPSNSRLSTAELAKIGYQGRTDLRSAGIKWEYTQEEIFEYIKCVNDRAYFCKTYVKILHPDRGEIPFDAYPYQEKLLNDILPRERFVAVLFPRQSGKTTTMVGKILYDIIFKQGQTVGIMANKQDVSIEILRRLKYAYERLPFFLQQGVKVWNVTSIHLENDSQVYAFATSPDAGSAYSFSTLYVDEVAKIKKNTWEDFWQSVFPTISSGKKTQVILVSTAKGMNHWYKIWTDAKNRRSDFFPVEIQWNEVPGRDEEWKKKEIARLGPNGEEIFAQEYSNVFQGSSTSLIKTGILQRIDISKQPDKMDDLDRYFYPEQGHSYLIPADTSHGVGKDYHAFSVIDVTSKPYIQVAKYRANNITAANYAMILKNAAVSYNNAMVLVENNDIGYETARALWEDYEYENLVYTTTKGFRQVATGVNGVKTPVRGVRMTPGVKRMGCSMLKELLETGMLKINDFETVNELSNFVGKGDSFAADEGYNDDLVMGLVSFGWLTTQKWWKDLQSEMIVSDAAIPETQLPVRINNGISSHDSRWIEKGKDKEGKTVNTIIWEQVF